MFILKNICHKILFNFFRLQPRESFRVTKYLTEETDSDSDEELSSEAKLILKKRKKEQERLSKLGKMIPICTSA